MKFEEAENYLFSLGNEVLAMKLGLENIELLLKGLGAPAIKYRKVQIAGTNGKGSTCAFLEGICLNANIKTGLFTSPHLVKINERIRINGADIEDVEFARLSTLVREVSEELYDNGTLGAVPTFFEQVTAIALLAFAEAGVELAILETGLGGRYDATTAARAELAGITRIDYDHQRYLGDTIEQIAAEKAAIIWPGSRVVALQQSREAEMAINRRCDEVRVKPKWATTEIAISGNAPTQKYSFKTEKATYADIALGLAGKHQALNAAVAIGLAEELGEMEFAIESSHIRAGLESAKHPGRLEFYKGVLLDGAHNPGGALALREYLEEFVQKPITLIFGAMLDKKIDQIAPILFPVADQLILTRAHNERAADPIDLDFLANHEAHVAENIGEALKIAEQFPENLTCVTGSLYLVGEARKLLGEGI